MDDICSGLCGLATEGLCGLCGLATNCLCEIAINGLCDSLCCNGGVLVAGQGGAYRSSYGRPGLNYGRAMNDEARAARFNTARAREWKEARAREAGMERIRH
jgi:hypothetical protein